MAIELTKQETTEILPSLQKFFREELEVELSEMRARLVLNYFMTEIAPFAYNRGIGDAESFLRARVEDLPGSCYEQPLTYWTRKKK